MITLFGIVAALVLFTLICRRSLFAGTMVFLGALPTYLVRFDLGPVPTTLLELLFAILLVTWLIRFYDDRHKTVSAKNLLLHRKVWWVGIGTLLLSIGGFLGLLQTADTLSTLGILKSYLVEPILFGWILLHVAWYQNVTIGIKVSRNIFCSFVASFALALAIPTVIISVWAIVQWGTGITIPVEWFAFRRATSIFPYPNAVGHFVAPVTVFLFAALLYRKPNPIFKRSSEKWIALVVVLGLVAMFASQTEAALVGTVVAMTAAAFLLIDRPIKQRLLLGGAGLIIFVIAIFGVPQLREKVLLQDWSGQTRTAQWSETWRLLSSSPRTFVLGVGANNYPTAVAPFHTHAYFEIFQYPHNIVLNIWTELGLAGLFGFCILAVTIGRSWVLGDRLAMLASLPLLEMTIHGLVDVPFFKNDLAMMTFTFIALWLMTSTHAPNLRPVPSSLPHA